MPFLYDVGTTDQTAAIAALEAQATALAAQIASAQATLASVNTILTDLNAGNYYTESEVNALLASKADTSALAGKANTSHTHTASQISDSTTFGRALMVAASAAAGRSTLGLGTAATMDATAFEPAGAVAAHNALANAHSSLTRPKEYRLTFTGSDSNTRTVTTSTQPLVTATWLSLFPATSGFVAAAAVAIGSEWEAFFDATLDGVRASKTRSEAGGGGGEP